MTKTRTIRRATEEGVVTVVPEGTVVDDGFGRIDRP
jgi:hypothetical protein